jgi:TRAP-type mannitol/chloroaromatic compound transport system permease small subunit
MALLPLGFGLLGLQGLSELIKCVRYLRGMLPEPSGIRGQGTSAPKAKP